MQLAKTIRPYWVCMMLCSSHTITAAFLMEIMYRANLTKYKKHGNPLLAYSYEEWSDLLGLSIGQLRKAAEGLQKRNLVKFYNRPHPFKPGVLKALHIEVPKILHDCFVALADGTWGFLDHYLLFKPKQESKFKIDIEYWLSKEVIECDVPPGGQVDASPECTSVDAVGTPNSYIVKEEDKEKIAAQNKAAEKSAKIEENYLKEFKLIEFDEVKDYPTLEHMLSEVISRMVKYHEPYLWATVDKE